MKINRRCYEIGGGGFVALTIEESEDMWHIYNLICVGDKVEAQTVRKVVTETATGTTDSQRVRTKLMIAVEKIEFDDSACVLRLNGRNVKENAFVKLGAYHTLDLKLKMYFTLTKEHWDSMHIERLDLANDDTQNAEIAAVVMQEGLAYLCLITPSMTLTKAKIDVNIPRKRKGFSAQHDKAMQKFYETVLRAMKTHINLEVVKCILLASPGFVKDHMFEYLTNSPAQGEYKQLLENRSKFLLCHSSSGFKHSLQEVLQDPQVQARMADVKAADEIRSLENFYQMIQTEPARSFYGWNHVKLASDSSAIATLFISDSLFRNKNFTERKPYVDLVERVRESGGEVLIFSSQHVSGERLNSLTGIAAILRFPMPEIEDEPLSSDDD